MRRAVQRASAAAATEVEAGPSASTEPLSLARRAAVSLAACVFVGATIWQVATRRDDWPLSNFEMYSGLEGPVSSRSVVKGVSDQGEFDLKGDMLPLGGARLRHLNAKLERNKARQRRFVSFVQRRYDERRAAAGWPVLQGIRSYSETWQIQRGLAGIDQPKRRATGSLYLLPESLRERLDAERAGQAPVMPPQPLPAGDALIEPGDADCGSGCEPIEDRHASGGRALRLRANGKAGASLTARARLAAGRWLLFVRMRTPPASGSDRVTMKLDGERLGRESEVGRYAATLGSGAWVWASEAPGERPLRVSVGADGEHTFSLELSQGSADIDQIWLSRARAELPVHNDPLAP